jgi:type VI protein secretion system component Hcp
MSLKPAWWWCLVAILLLAGPGTAVAQSDVFMCVDRITGSSTDEDFQGCSEVFGVSYSVGIDGGKPPSGTGGGAPRTTCGLYVVSKAVDRSSIPVLIRSLLGRRTAEVEFAIRKRGEEPLVFLQLILRDVLIVEVGSAPCSPRRSPRLFDPPGQMPAGAVRHPFAQEAQPRRIPFFPRDVGAV